MDDKPPPPFEDDEKNALEGLVDVSAPPLKTQSYSQQLRTNTGTNMTKRRHQMRNHSLDDSSKQSIMVRSSNNTYGYYFGNSSDEEDDEGFYPYSASLTTPKIGGGSNNNGNDFIKTFHTRSCDVLNGGSTTDFQQQPLPEFVGTGGGIGIFKVPSRAAVHPTRPPCLELRPHPLRETQVGKFLRSIACTETELWGGQESGVRVWNLCDAYKSGHGRARRGDGDAAPFYESVSTSPVLSLMADPGSKLVWSGHKDGKIRSWKTDQPRSKDSPFKESLSWQAHRGPVLSMVISSYGDIWSGSEGGYIKNWPWESIEKSLNLSQEERRMAALLVERAAIDLKSQVTVNGACSISSSDVRYLLSDTVRARVLAVSSLQFSMWDARTRDLIKVFNADGVIETRVDTTSSMQDQTIEDEINVKFVSKSKKEKSQGFFQRSRNAFIGAADAVRRVATKGAFSEDNKKTEAIILAADGLIWTGCSNGLIVQWDGNGNRVQDFIHHPCAVLSFCTYASRIWVGYISGMVQVFDLEGNLLAGWIAHNGPIIKLVVGKEIIFSLANHGGIRGWSIASPAPTDGIVRQILAEKELMYTRRENVKILVGTWNVGQGRVSQESLATWLGSAVSDVGIVVVGLQEVEMGAGFLAMSAAKETVGLEGSSIGLWWQDNIGKVLDETTFERVGSRQLAGLLIAVWVKKTLRGHIGDLDVGAVPCGLGRAIGNKGGVGLRIRVFDRIMCFMNCHFAAHLEAVARRNGDFDHIFRNMSFSRSSNLPNNAAAGVSSAAQTLRSQNSGISSDDGKPDLADADMVVFIGDFNYRLSGISYDEARDFVSQRTFDWLRKKDQLRAEMLAGKVFQGMREAMIRFPPTYKFERGKPGLGGYDSGEKKRIPAWCDRVLYRDNRGVPTEECSLECPVVATVLQYDACMDVIESDHKPVRCKFNVEIAHVDRSVRREELGKILEKNEEIRAYHKELQCVPEILLSHNRIVLHNQEKFSLRITNKSKSEKAYYQIVCQGQSTFKEDENPEQRPRGCYGFPHWLEVTPAAGVLQHGQAAEILIHHQEIHTLEEYVDDIPQSWWSEDTRDKEIILSVNVRGSCSLATQSHQIHVHQRFSAPSVHLDPRSIGTKHQGSSHNRTSHQRSTHRQRSANSDKTDEHQSLRGP